MNKKWKQTLALCLALILLLGAAPLTAAAKTSIPADALEYNGHSYKVYKESMTWDKAKVYCESVGGHLVSITTREENTVVMMLIDTLPRDYDVFIGLSGDDWNKWVTGEPVSYSNWGKNEPDNLGASGQSKGAICNGTRGGTGDFYHCERGQWDDIENWVKRYFICEWETTNKNVKSVSVDDMTINYKQNATLRPVIEADNGSTVVVAYESMNPAAVTVDEYGNIYGAKPGIADIKVTVEDDTGKAVSDTCTVTVKYSPIQWIIVIVLFGWIWY